MPAIIPTIAELETALKHLYDPEALCLSPLATLDLVHNRVAPEQRSAQRTPPLPWIYGYELAALLREHIEQLRQEAEAPQDSPALQHSASRHKQYAQILQLRFGEGRTWAEVADALGLAAGHIQNKLKRPALQLLLGHLFDPHAAVGARGASNMQAPPILSHLNNLPQPDAFIGRRAEVEHVLAKLRRRRMPIIEISGIGGVGKSALAKHIAWRTLEEGMFDAAIWVSAKQDHLPISGQRASSEREALRSLNDLFETMAQVLGISYAPVAPDARRRQLLDILGSGRFPRGVLLIVDNYETLRPDEQERIAAFLFEELPYPSQALITSRHEELLVTVYSHILPIKVHLERMSDADARACLNHFLSLESPPLVTSAAMKEQIITIADQIPLAMLWLLGQLRSTPQAQPQILRDLGQRRGTNAVLSYIFDHSYALLAGQDDARTVLHSLSVFSTPITLAPLIATAALDAAAAPPALMLLQQLSLVVGTQDDEPRYELLALAHSYLAEHVSDAERQLLLERAATHYAEQGQPADRPEILPLLEWAIESGRHALTLALFDILTKEQFAESDSQVRDCAAFGADVVRAARALGLEQRANWYESFAIYWPQIMGGELSAVQSALQRLLEQAQQYGWQENIALACSTLGLLFNDLGEAAASAGRDPIALFETAAAYLRRAAALWEDSQHIDWLAIVMGRLGTVARQLGDYDRALDYYTWTEALYDALGSDAGRASALGRRGYTLSRRYQARGEGDPQEIERLLLEALRLSEQIGNRWSVAANSLRYAEFLEFRHEPMRAISYAEHAFALFSMIPEPVRAQQAHALTSRLQTSLHEREA